MMARAAREDIGEAPAGYEATWHFDAVAPALSMWAIGLVLLASAGLVAWVIVRPRTAKPTSRDSAPADRPEPAPVDPPPGRGLGRGVRSSTAQRSTVGVPRATDDILRGAEE